MLDQELQAVLATAADQPAPENLLAAVQSEVRKRRTHRRWVRSSLAALVLLFSYLTFVPGGGVAVASVRQEIQPTLFLKTNLGEAQRVAHSPLVLPGSVPGYNGQTIVLGPDTPALVGRWLSYETVAVTVAEKEDGLGVISFDLRRSTDLSRDLSLVDMPPGGSTQAVKVGDYDGIVVLSRNHPLYVSWKTESHFYRLLVGGASTVDELIAVARQIQ